MKKNLYHLYQKTLSKYEKFKSRYDKGIKTGRFFELSAKKRALIISRIRRLKQRLASLKLQLKLAAAGVGLALVLSGSPAQAQQLGPFVESQIKNPLPPPPSSSFNREHPAFVDIDNDGDLDVFIGSSYGRLVYFRNDGTPEKPFFVAEYSTGNPADGIDIGYDATPAFADLDKDADYDLIIGERAQYTFSPYSNINYYENTGTASAPIFTLPSGEHPMDNVFSDSYYGHPAFVDIDNNGDLDVFVGSERNTNYASYRETIKFWRNDGSLPVAQFTAEEGASNPISIINPEFGGTLDRAAPTFADIDGDNDKDLFVGDYDGNIRYFRNDGAASAPVFTSENTGSSNPFDGFDVGSLASPAFGDLDNDGDLDAIIGKDSSPQAHTRYFENIGNATSPQFVERTGLDNPFDGVDTGYEAAPTFVDIDGDSDLDAVIGGKYPPNNSGHLAYFQNDGSGQFTEIVAANPFNGLTNIDNQVPTLVNFDGDSDFDLFIGHNDGLAYFENQGNATTGSFTPPGDLGVVVPSYLSYVNKFRVTFSDVDEDGDLEAVSGRQDYASDANLEYFNNIGANQFGLDNPNNPFSSIVGLNEPQPRFVDIDHDGSDDLFVGLGDGTVLFFPKTAPETFDLTMTPTDNPLNTFDVGVRAAVDFADIDEDGDLDAFIGDFGGQINYFENQNQPPTTNGNPAPTSFTEGDGITNIESFVDIFDSDDDDIISATISIVNNYIQGEDVIDVTLQGGVTGSFDATTGVYTLQGTAKILTYEAIMQSATYFNNNLENPTPNARTVEFAVTDFDNTDPFSDSFPEFQISVQVTPVNDAPTLATSSTSSVFIENNAPIIIDNAVLINDVDDNNLESATVSINNFVAGEDILVFSDQNNITGSFNNTTGVLTLTGTDNVANYQLALRSVAYTNSSDTPDITTRNIEFQVNDGTNNSTIDTKAVDVVPANDAPQLTNSTGGTIFTEDAGSVIIDNALTLNDADDTDIEGATISITTNFTSTEDQLLFTDQNGITGSYDGATGVLSLSGTASVADYETALRTITYNNISDNPNTSNRNIDFAVNDGTDNSNVGSKSVSITPVNDPPGLFSENDGITLSYDQNAQPSTVDGLIDIFDVDDTNVAGATITISGFQSGDNLDFSDQNSITGNFSSGVLSLSGVAPIADYITALRSIGFESTNGEGTRTIEFIINDGTDNSTPYIRNINIQSSASPNQPPSVTTPGTTQEGSIITIDLCEIISDPDNDFNELTIEVSTSSGASTVVNGCDLTIDYSGTNFSGNDEVVIEACDPSGSCDQNTLSIQVEAITEVNVFNAVSPNNDGLNDFWEIQGLTQPNSIVLFNRWGDEVKSISDAESPIANINLDDLPAATYFYKITSPEGTFEGYIVIKK